jgi:FMN phosphatase YigB (HAD superfamily)
MSTVYQTTNPRGIHYMPPELAERLQFILANCTGMAIDLYRTVARTEFPEPINNLRESILKLPEGSVDPELFLRVCLSTPFENTDRFLDAVAAQCVLSNIGKASREEFRSFVEVEKCNLLHYSDVKPALKQLKERFALALVTNSWPFPVTKFLVESGLKWLFDVVVISSIIGHTKQDGPEIYNITAVQMKMPPKSIVMVGDNWDLDILPALAAGMYGILCDRNEKYVDRFGNWKDPEMGKLGVPFIRDFNYMLPSPVVGH